MDKTEILLSGKLELLLEGTSPFGPLNSFNCMIIQNLGVQVDISFKLDNHISAVVQHSFYQLSLISKIKP